MEARRVRHDQNDARQRSASGTDVRTERVQSSGRGNESKGGSKNGKRGCEGHSGSVRREMWR